MIPVTPMAGGTMLLNADLIEAIECDPHTVILLANGRRLVVNENPTTLVSHINRVRASLLAAVQDVSPREDATVVPFRQKKGHA